jgi:hypothetical protein
VSDPYRAHLRARLEANAVPEHLHTGLVEYLAARRPVGGFLLAVLENNLALAAVRADPESARALRELVLFLSNFASATAWGSTEAVAAWLTDPTPAPELFE